MEILSESKFSYYHIKKERKTQKTQKTQKNIRILRKYIVVSNEKFLFIMDTTKKTKQRRRQMKKRVVAVLCTIMMASGMLAGCGQANSHSEKSGSGETEITFWGTSSSTEDKQAIEDMIDRFEEENPDITVKYEGMEGEAYKTKIKTVISSNSLPDVFTYWVGEQFETLVSSGNVMDLSTMYEEDTEFTDTFVEGALDEVTYNGKIYGAPTDITCMTVWYNKKIFEENNVSVPKTYEELKEVIAKLEKNGVTPIVVGGKDRWPFLGWFSYLAQRIGGVELYNEVCQGNKDFTEDAFVKAGEELKALSQHGFINGSLSIDSATSESLFAAGEAAMLVSGSWSVTTITSNEKTADDFSFFPFPAVTGGKEEEAGYLYGGVANTLAVSNNTEHKEAAQKFLKFYLSEDEQTKNVERTGTFSPVQVSPDSNNMTALAYDFSQYVSEEVDGF